MGFQSMKHDFSDVHQYLKSMREELSENQNYLKQKEKLSKTAENLVEIFSSMLDSADKTENDFIYIETRAHEYDVDAATQANGFWSVLLFARCIIREVKESVGVFTKRKKSWFFDWRNYLKEIRSTSHALAAISTNLSIHKELMLRTEKGSLILNETFSFKDLLKSARRSIRVVSFCLAAHSEVYYSGGLKALCRCIRLMGNRNHRAIRSIVVSQYASPYFFKSFLALPETGLTGCINNCLAVTRQPISVNRLLYVQPTQLVMTTVTGIPMEVQVPTSHIGPSALPIRLLSNTRRRGLKGVHCFGRRPTDDLLLHFHGGGFIGQTSKSHESYLRSWARKLNCTIASVDYSLAPEAPHPRPSEEAFYAYCYALKYPEKFGWTGKTIVLAGDSAGGLLITGIVIKSIVHKVRIPDGALMIYTPFLASARVSPGRVLVLLDPLVSIGFLTGSCKSLLNRVDLLKRYQDHEEKLKVNVALLEDIMTGKERVSDSTIRTESTRSNNTSKLKPQTRAFLEMKRNAFNPIPFTLDDFDDAPQDLMLSPLITKDDILRKFPAISLLVKKIKTTDFDPFLDDNIEFAKRLKGAGVQYDLHVLRGLGHGFLSVYLMCSDARKGSKKCCRLIKNHFNRSGTQKYQTCHSSSTTPRVNVTCGTQGTELLPTTTQEASPSHENTDKSAWSPEKMA